MATVPSNTVTSVVQYGRKPSSVPGISNSASRAMASSARVFDTSIAIEADRLRRKQQDIDAKYRRRMSGINGAFSGIEEIGKVVKSAYEFQLNNALFEDRMATREAEIATQDFRSILDKAYNGGFSEETGEHTPGIRDMPFTEMSTGEFGTEPKNPVLSVTRLYKDYIEGDKFSKMSKIAQDKFKASADTILRPYLRNAEHATLLGLEKQKELLRKNAIENASEQIKNVSNVNGVSSGAFDNAVESNVSLMILPQFEHDGLIKVHKDDKGNENIEYLGTEEVKEETRKRVHSAIQNFYRVSNGALMDVLSAQYIESDNDATASEIMSMMTSRLLTGLEEMIVLPGKEDPGEKFPTPLFDEKILSGYISEGKDTYFFTNEQLSIGAKRLKELPLKRKARMENDDRRSLEQANLLLTEFMLGPDKRDRNSVMEKIGETIGGLKVATSEEKRAITQEFADKAVSFQLSELISDYEGNDPYKIESAAIAINEDPVLRSAYDRILKSREEQEKAPAFETKAQVKEYCDEILNRARNEINSDSFTEMFSETYKMFESGRITPEQYRKMIENLKTQLRFTMFFRQDPNNKRDDVYLGIISEKGFDVSGILDYDDQGRIKLDAQTGSFLGGTRKKNADERKELILEILDAFKRFDVLSIIDPENPALFNKGKKMTLQEYADIVLSGKISKLKRDEIIARTNMIAARLHGITTATPAMTRNAEKKIYNSEQKK